MAQISRTLRIFVSSTFSDLQWEHNALQKRVFPKIRELCLEHGCRLQTIELKWGVRKVAALDQQTMKIYFEEIARFQKTSPRPKFIVLLGDRYGWCPLPYEIPAYEFDQILANIANMNDIKLLTHWFKRDDNAVPPVYDLQPRTGKFIDSANWERVEHQIRSILLEAIKRLQFKPGQLLKYIASATEQEIVQGALKIEDANEHVFCFLRNIENLPQGRSASDFIDLGKDGKLNLDAQRQMMDFKERLYKLLPDNTFSYKAKWEGNGITAVHIDQLCEDAFASLSRVILKEISYLEAVDPLAADIANRAAFIKDHTKFFTGRTAILQTISDYIKGIDPHPLAIFGASGCGKTALMAKAVEQALERYSDSKVIFRFIGAIGDSLDGRAMFSSICRQIYQTFDFEKQKRQRLSGIKGVGKSDQKERLKIEEEYSIPQDFNELLLTFRDFLFKIPTNSNVILFLDGLDQFFATDHARNLTWLPTKLPEHVRLIVSTLQSEILSILKRKLPEANLVELKPMPLDEGKKVIDLWLKDAGRQLQDHQWNEVVVKFSDCGLPLYLKLAFEEARRWKSYTEKTELNTDIPGMFLNLFARLSSDANHGKVLLSKALGYLGSSKNGLTEDELIDVLSYDKEVVEDFIHYSFLLPPGERLPVVIWSRLYFDLEPYLTDRTANGTTLITFYHRQLADVVRTEFLEGESKNERHKRLANYFNYQPLWFEKDSKKIPNYRKVSELPYQQTYGNLWAELEQTLCDLYFIEAKCMAGGTYELVTDYLLAVSIIPNDINNSSIHRKILEFEHFVRTHGHLFTTNPLQVFPQAANEPDMTRPAVAAKQLWKNGIEQRPWLQWVNKPSHKDPCLLTIGTRGSSVKTCAYSPDDRRIVSASWDGILTVWDAESGEELWHLDAVHAHSCAWSPDGSNIAAGSSKDLRIWDAETGEQIQAMEGYSKSCEYSPDGRRIISASEDNTLNIWDAKTGEGLLALTGHTAYVSSWAYSPDGLHIASVDRNGNLRFWDAETGQLQRTLNVGREVNIVYSPDARRLISYGWMTLKVWDAQTGEELRVFQEIADRVVNTCAYSPDGRRIAAACADDTLGIWDVDTGKRLHVFTGHTKKITACAYSPDGRKLVSASWDKTLKVWDLATGKCTLVLEGHSEWVTACSVANDGRRVVSASFDKTLILWDIETGDKLRILRGHKDAVVGCTFSPDGRHVASVSRDNSLKVWDSQMGEPILTLTGIVGSPCSYSPDGRWLLTGGDDGTIQMWDANSGEMVRTLTGHSRWVNACTYSPDGKYIATASADRTLKLWDAQTGEDLRTLCEHSDKVEACIFSPNGQWLISTGEDGTLRLWQVEMGNELRILAGRPYQIKACCCSPDRHRLAFGCSDGVLRIWDTVVGRETQRIYGHSDSIEACTFSRDGCRLLSGSSDGTLKVWDLEALEGLATPSQDQGRTRACAYSPDGNHIVSAHDNKLEIRDGESGKVLRTLGGHSGDIHAGAYSPDGSRILSASHDRTLRVWDAEDGRSLSWLVGHRYEVYSCAYSPDGRWVISGANDSTLKIWDPAIGETLLTLHGHHGPVDDCTYSPDGRCILSASNDHTLKLWNAESGVELHTLAGHFDDVRGCAYSPDGRLLASTSADGTLKIWDARTGLELETAKSGGRPRYSPDGNRIIAASWRDSTLRVHDARTGACLATLVCSAPVFDVVTAKGGRNIACGGRRHGVRIFRLLGLEPGIPIATVVRLYLPNRSYESTLGYRCSWCGRRSPAPPAILDSIAGITNDAQIGPNDPPCLTLPLNAWDEPGLIGACPLCQKPLKFNPFVVDNRDRANRLSEQWTRVRQGRNRLVFLTQEAIARRESGNLDGAVILHQDNERFCREIEDKQDLWWSLKEQAEIFMDQGKLEPSMTAISEAEQLCRDLGTPEGLAVCLANSAILLLKMQQLPEAERLAIEAHHVAANATEFGLHKEVLVIVHDQIGDALQAQSDYPRALEAYRRAIGAVEHLILYGSSSDFGRRATVLLQKKIEHASLMEKDPDTALDRLIAMLANTEEQGWAINTLSQVGQVAVERLIEALGDHGQQGGAASALHSMSEPPIDRLVEILDDPLRKDWAIYLLSKIRPPAVDKLIAALADPGKQAGAACALHRMSEPPIDRLVEILDDPLRKPSAIYLLSEIGPPAVDKLIAALADPGKRAGATCALHRMSEPPIDRLVEILDDPLRKPSAIYLLSEIGPPAVNKLIAALADPGKRAGAAYALSEIGQEAVGSLIAVLDDECRGLWARAALSIIRGD